MNAAWTLIRAALAAPEQLRQGDDAVTARLIGVGALCAAAFGAVVGSLHPGIQPLYSAVKMPLVLILPMVVTLPTLHRLMAATDAPMAWSQLTREAAIAIARIGLLLVITLPLVWFVWVTRPGHAIAIQLLAALMATAFYVGVRPIFLLTASALAPLRFAGVALIAITLGQTAWMLRPFVGAPYAPVVFLEDGTGFFLQGVLDPMYRHCTCCDSEGITCTI